MYLSLLTQEHNVDIVTIHFYDESSDIALLTHYMSFQTMQNVAAQLTTGARRPDSLVLRQLQLV